MITESTLHLQDTDKLRDVRVIPAAAGTRRLLIIDYGTTEVVVAGSPAQIESLQSRIALTPDRVKRYARSILGPEASETAVALAASLLLNTEKREREAAEDSEQDGRRVAHG